MNIFTNDDYRRIQAWLKANAIKDSDFAISENTVPDEDILVITQNMSTVPTNYKIKIKDLLNSSLGKVVIDKITANIVKVNNSLTVDASKVILNNEKGTTLQDVLNYFEENKLNRHTDDTFDGNLTVKKNITIEGNIKSHDDTITVEADLEATGEITDGHGNLLNDVNSAAKQWSLEYQDPQQDEPTVRAKYVLKDYRGVPKGSVIKIYKDSAITNVYLGTVEDTCNPDTGEVTKHPIHDNNEALSIVYRLDTGKYSLVNVPIKIFTIEAEFDKYRGLGITENGQVFVKLASDVESSNYLHFNASGELSADGIENRILRDLGTIINSVADDGTMWGQYKKEEGTKDSPINEASRWGQYKQAEADRNELLNTVSSKVNQLEQEQIQGGVYDISVHNGGIVFESLQALLSSANLSTLIPTSVRHGGMSIRFVQGSEQSSDNKYVQYRLKATSFTKNIKYWEKENLVKFIAFSSLFSVDYSIKVLKISKGYAFVENDAYSISQQTVDFSSITSLNYIILTLNGDTATIGIQQYDQQLSDTQYKIGYIPSSSKKVILDVHGIEDWKEQQNVFSCVPTNCKFSDNKETKVVSVSAGYVFIGKVPNNVSAHSFSYNNLNSLNYIVFNIATRTFELVPYSNDLSDSQFICGYATSGGIVKITNQYLSEQEILSAIKRIEGFNALVSTQIGEATNIVVPSSDYLENIFNVPMGGGASDSIYYDTRYIIKNNKIIKKLSILSYNSGILNIYFIGMDNSIITYIPVTVTAGRNDIPITLPSQYNNIPMYVGINSNEVYWNMQSGSPTTYNRKISISTGNLTNISYASAYAIEIADSSEMIKARVDALSPFTDIDEAIASGVNDIVLAAQDFEISSPIIMRDGMTIRGSFGKTRLILTDGCTTAISASNVNNIKISDLEIVGTCPDYAYEMNGIIEGQGYDMVEDEYDAETLEYMGNERGIYLYYAENVVLENLKINHINGSAIRVDHTGRDYIKGLNASNLFITNCYNGIYTEDEHEFSQYTNFTITLCMIGLYVTSGNLIFTSGHLTRCRVAVEYLGGYNHAHGICNGLEIKHNQIAGILCKDIANGQQFTGCYVSYCNIIIRDSKGITFDALTMGQGSIICSGNYNGAGGNYIQTLFNRTGSVSISNTGNLVVQQNLNLDLLPK